MVRIISVTLLFAVGIVAAVWVYNSNKSTTMEQSAQMPEASTTPAPVMEEDDTVALPLSEPAQEAFANIRAVVAQSVQDGGTAPKPDATNNEAAPVAQEVGAAQVNDESFVREKLAPENFNAETVVALIQAAPRLSIEQKAELQTAVQSTINYPDARAKILENLETILLSLN